MADDKEARIEKLEIDLAHALNTIDELNTVVFDQGRQLDRLNRLVTNMTDQVTELMENVLPGHQPRYLPDSHRERAGAGVNPPVSCKQPS